MAASSHKHGPVSGVPGTHHYSVRPNDSVVIRARLNGCRKTNLCSSGSDSLALLMNLDRTFFWIAMASSVALLVRTMPLLRQQRRGVGWVVVGAVILVVGGAAEVFLPAYAGALVGAFWAVLVVLPSLLIRALLRAALGQRYAQAERIAKVVRWLHPADGWRETPELYRALALAQAGQRDRAADLFHGLMDRPGIPAQVAATARVYLYRMEGRWDEMLAWTEGISPGGQPTLVTDGEGIKRDGGEGVGQGTLVHDPSVLLMRVRALGETGQLSDMLRAFQVARTHLARLPHPTVWPTCQLSFFAFAGRETAVAGLLEGPLAGLTPGAKAFWRATARMAASQADAARADLRELAARHEGDQELRHAIERRLTRDLTIASEVFSSAEQAMLDGIEAEVQRDRAYHPQAAAGGLRRAPVTLALVFLNLGVFALETYRGGSQDLRTLLRMGALWPHAVLAGGQWYRLLTALFLHFGPVHLVMNLLGLAVIGPWVEKTLGRTRYAAVYLVAGVGSMAAVLGLIHWGWMREEVLVGASGAIMGLVGATGALMAVGWRRERSGLAARRLRGIVLIVVLQAVFDLMTPQVSFAAHAAGLLVGFLLTALLAAFTPRKA